MKGTSSILVRVALLALVPMLGARSLAQGQPCGAGVTVQVTATPTGAHTWSLVATVDGASAVYNYAWNPGDGQGTSGGGTAFDHTFGAPGSYLMCVSVDVLDQQGDFCTATGCVVINNTGLPPTVCDSTELDFAGSFDNGTFTFALESIITTPITGVVWDFGDGATGSGTSVSHSFTGNGPYAVCMTVTLLDAVLQDSCTVQSCNWVYFGPDTIPCGQVLQPDFDHLINGNTVAFINTSLTSGALPNLLWDFGDGTTSTELQPVHTYALPNLYSVCLSVTIDGPLAPDTCTLSVCLPVELMPLVGIDEEDAHVFTVSPNPCADVLAVRSEPGSAMWSVEVLDTQGRRCWSGTLNTGLDHVDVSGLSAGPYLLRVRNGQRARAVRFLKE
ncbi:MAG: PKD domain-containing protein [Flavobacteriales bacterium]|nr:PKD domain-containing protein [Flavobacteriales bacterium]MBK7943095.1 PKD domain-containing protein [Flavobacteriales bacterium]MBK9698502.1 PKD domain-containing protein [Flavobacteriales bacterium]